MDERPAGKRGRKPALRSLFRQSYASERGEQVRKANTLAFLQQAEYIVGKNGGPETPVQLLATIRREPQLPAMLQHNKQLLDSSCGEYFLLCTHLEILDLAARSFGYELMPELTLERTKALLDSCIAASNCGNKAVCMQLTLDLQTGEVSVDISMVTPRFNLLTGLQRHDRISLHMPYPRLAIDCVFTFPSLYTMFSTTKSDAATLAIERRNAAAARLRAQSKNKVLDNVAQSPIDVLLVNSLGMLLGTPTDSVAILRRGIWLTPSLVDGARSDAMRTELLKMGVICEGSVEAQRLRKGEEIMVFSSLIGITRGTIALDVPELALKRRTPKASGKANIPLQTLYRRMHHNSQLRLEAQRSIGRSYAQPVREKDIPGTGVFHVNTPK